MPDRTELATALSNTETAVKDLADKVDIHQSTLNRVKVVFALGLIGLVLDMTLTVLVGWGLVGVNHNQSRVNELQAALQTETERNTAAQCAVITLFLQFEPKTTSNPAYTEEQRQQQLQAYQTLRRIGQNLGCANQ